VVRSFSIALVVTVAIAATALAQNESCSCDCDGDGRVGVGELIVATSIGLERVGVSSCPAADADGDGRVGLDELVAGVRAGLDGCPSALPTALPTATPAFDFDPEVPPAGGDELLAWLRQGRYRTWRGGILESASHAEQGATYYNDALFRSLVRIPPAWNHPVGAAAVQELYGADPDRLRGWAVSVRVADDLDELTGWTWYRRFDETTRTDERDAPVCVGCHADTSAGFNRGGYLSRDPVFACAEQDRPHEKCGNLAAPDLACAYDGELSYGSNAPKPGSLYLRPGPYVFLEGTTYFARGEKTLFSVVGEFDERYCASDFPRPVDGALVLSEDTEQIEFTRFTSTGDVGIHFIGRRRD